MIARLLPVLLALLLALPPAGRAQEGSDPAMLVADRVWLENRTRVVAEGSVEVVRGETRLRATRVSYDRETERLDFAGPIVLTRGDDQIVLASSAELDRDFRNGLIRSARLVLDRQLQLAAARLDRVDGRYAQLTRATVSSCQVCGNRPPLWQIKARRVIHDREEMQLYFDDARMEVLGVPIFWVPRLRLPDPNQTRATGFLIPSIRRNSQLATGIKVPYFIRIGDHRDLTLTPYLSKKTRTLEWRYRQAFTNGRMEFGGAFSSDDLYTRGGRAYLRGDGQFDLARDFKLDFRIEAVSDDAYLTDYSYSDNDRLESNFIVSRVRRDEYIAAGLAHYHSLRVNEVNSRIPTIIGDLTYERRYFPRLGGEVRISAENHSHLRYSDVPFDGPDADTITDGRDVTRLNLGVTWHNTWTLPLGIRAEGLAGVLADSFRTGQDINLPHSASEISPTASVTLRWPWVRHAASGVTDTVEPVAMVAWTGGDGLLVANDESTRVEFDEGNLLSLSRFPAPDRRERGLRAALGVNWTRLNAEGWDARLTLGSVLRDRQDTNFTRSSGLANTTSDLLIAGQFRNDGGLGLTARGLFSSSLKVNKAEARASWTSDRYDLSASYVWLSADPAEDRPIAVSEWLFNSGFDLNRHLRGRVSGRYDIVADKPISAGLGLLYSNECIDVELSVSRRFTSSTIVTPATDFSFTIGLRGFSAASSGRGVARTCR
ncbi:organic solvent tolerance protein, putative [Pseudooceanicola batsensis HTCC2597]|uniref:LPS-assembly protein LptD n=1 Tax=Pseudooceanicola batsensis (strain ATCC BAA-863 / DSM 15984 / KCTC 12145 / HTCC2597) TaxID=252305 RepID=A3TXB2_PSEBH|nr:LPS assembly protein LptD [Pseudooceanicola batsensis]EAQ03472.1 organic solvent tolerance protein, putative [Pseudooceanicola batsensis HTCC2597]